MYRLSALIFCRKMVRSANATLLRGESCAAQKFQAMKSTVGTPSVPMLPQLGGQFRKLLQNHDGNTELLFVNRTGRPFSANTLREKVPQPSLEGRLGIPCGSFRSMGRCAAGALHAERATRAVAQKQLPPSSPRITLGVYAHIIGSQQRKCD
jgi:integrase